MVRLGERVWIWLGTKVMKRELKFLVLAYHWSFSFVFGPTGNGVWP